MVWCCQTFQTTFYRLRPIRLIESAYFSANQFKKIDFKERKSIT
ncbi:hypothetical protein NEIMUCOT_06086 [Neisseria mucosa ATCC 25996]|uniref:Uncharacterized protein n=1 Tax=Neisseria mucosa (strain ATCC 25996 / DSM 4631 / NCTC 10774 / M26) TaxID=546266 RepID=D2ZZK9_NEIM2|nr:hypothetical protein NEIMUCOT_06086 [Neisseria mucosa ATCC 25996]